MRKPTLVFIGIFLLGLLCAPNLQAQCDHYVASCKSLVTPFRSDGQYYRAQLYEGEHAKVRITLYSGMVYRIIPCGMSSTGAKPNISIYDHRGVGVFFSSSMPNESYFDFSFGATADYSIEARFSSGEGCVGIIVGHMDAATAKENNFLKEGMMGN